MKKRLIICCDGTWNNPERKNVTNVVKIARGIIPIDRNGVHQVVYYDWGVGSEGIKDKVSGGVAGKGISKNIRDGYRFLIHNYAGNDEIYLFGFSRGAYTARSIAGLIRNSWLLRKEHADLVSKAYGIYRSRKRPDEPCAQKFRQQYCQQVRIKFIGVWDTVGSLGIPLRITKFVNQKKYGFHDTSLSGIIDHACHALAIDEKRKDFRPALWIKKPGRNQILEQVWFSGVHCDVGGGYKESGLSDIALDWMMERAGSQGLAFSYDYVSSHISPNAMGKKHSSYKGAYWLKGTYERPIGESGVGMENIHPSVEERFETDPRYKPSNLDAYLSTNQHQWRKVVQRVPTTESFNDITRKIGVSEIR